MYKGAVSAKVTARAIILDPSSFFREGMDSCLSKGGHVTLAQGRSLTEVVQRLDALTPNLALVGPNFSELESLALCREMTCRWSALKVILFTRHANDPLFQADVAHAGANACLSREAGEAEFLEAIEAVMAGYQLFPRDVLSQVFQPAPLTPREREVLQLLAKGKTDRQIADALTLGLPTIRKHSHKIIEKLGVHERREAVRRARRLGWV